MPNTLLRSLAAEARKVFAVRTWWILSLISLLYIGSLAAGVAFFLVDLGGALPVEVPAAEQAALVFSVGSSVGYVIPLAFGNLLATNEFRHRTLKNSFLAVPHRLTVLTAKSITAILGGAFLGIIAALSAVLGGAATMEALGVGSSLENPETLALIARIPLAMALWSLIGLAVGTLITNQIASIIVILAFTQIVEPVLRMLAGLWEWSGQLGKFLPGAASDSLVGAGLLNSLGSLDPSAGIDHQYSLGIWQGGLAMIAFALVPLILGYLRTWQKEVE